MMIISPGWGRTGTTSVAAALTRLGAGPCLQFNDMWARPDIAELFVDGGDHDWPVVLEEFRSSVEWPGCWVWRELAEAFPEAPLLLTNRDADEWFASFAATIHAHGASHTGASPGHRLTGRIWRDDFGSWEQALDRDHAVAAFERHYAEVRAAHPDRVVEYSVTDGWAPLCELLGVPVPDEPFPHLLTRAQFG